MCNNNEVGGVVEGGHKGHPPDQMVKGGDKRTEKRGNGM